MKKNKNFKKEKFFNQKVVFSDQKYFVFIVNNFLVIKRYLLVFKLNYLVMFLGSLLVYLEIFIQRNNYSFLIVVSKWAWRIHNYWRPIKNPFHGFQYLKFWFTLLFIFEMFLKCRCSIYIVAPILSQWIFI